MMVIKMLFVIGEKSRRQLKVGTIPSVFVMQQQEQLTSSYVRKTGSRIHPFLRMRSRKMPKTGKSRR